MEEQHDLAGGGAAGRCPDGDRSASAHRRQPSGDRRRPDPRRQRVADVGGAAPPRRRAGRRPGELGVGRGDTVAIMLGNRPEFHIVDLAAAMLGATPFSIYLTYPAERDRVPVHRRRLAGGDRRAGPHARAARGAQDLPGLEHVIVVDGDAPEDTVSLADIEGSDPDFDPAAGRAEIGPDDVVTLIYTSGTTGPPKGVQLSHHNIMSGTRRSRRSFRSTPARGAISWLPAAHIAERMAHHYIPVIYAGTITVLPEPARDPLLPAAGSADLVLRRPADLGEAQGRARDDAGGPARGAAPAGAGGAGGRHPAGAAAPARRGGAPSSRRGGPGRRADVLQAARDARARPGDRGQRRRRADAGRGARVLPRDRDRAGGAVGHVRDVRGWHCNRPEKSRSGRSDRRSRASRSRSPTTASCSSAASS